MDYLTILGRQSEIGIAELETLYGPGSIMPIGNKACFVQQKPDFARLGSSIKSAKFISTTKHAQIDDVLDASVPYIVEQRKGREGKLQLGISVYGHRVSGPQLNRSALKLKKRLRSKGLSVRLIPNKQSELNAAQILRNKLTKTNGIELNIIFDGKTVHVAQTLEVQDIDEYTRRDREKPVRDPLVGMLPPKLAQTLINLADTKPGMSLLDPFCGTGTVLMEAFAMGIDTCGSDISPNMVDATRVNMSWFQANKQKPMFHVELADATMHEWPFQIDAVAGETYLGPALRSLPDDKQLTSIVEEVDDIHRRFLQNLAGQTKSGVRIALAVPSWHKKGKFIDLPVLDDLEKLGYNPTSFVHVSDELVYHRPHQVVGRRIISLIRK